MVTVRDIEPGDAAAASAILRQAFAGEEIGRIDAAGVELLTQTGHALLVAERDGEVCGVVRMRDEDGIAWFDLLASNVAGAGRALVRAVEIRAQDSGLRLVRLKAPERRRLQERFMRWGYLPIARDGETLVMEKRLPLLTVREQRRDDAEAIGQLAAIDPWPLAQEARPGWFVLADGERVVGVVWVRDAAAGVASISEPALADEYRGRSLELWMIERATVYAETRGFHTAELPASPQLDVRRRDLEDRRWFPEGRVYRKSLGDRLSGGAMSDER